MKKIILIILTIIALAGLTSCKKQEGTAEKNAHSNADAIIDETQNELLEETAQEAAKAFTNGNMNDINKIVFGTTQINANDKLSEIWGENTSAQEALLLSLQVREVIHKAHPGTSADSSH